MIKIRKGSWSLACATLVLGFMLAVQLRTTADTRADFSAQRAEAIAARLVEAEPGDEVRMRAGPTPLVGPGVIVRLDDSSRKARTGENPNLYLIHDDDLLKVINELRAAGAEALSVNGQRLTGTSELPSPRPPRPSHPLYSSALTINLT